MFNETLGKLHFWSSLLSVNLLFFPMHFVGLAGMARRYADYPAQFANLNFWISIGGFWFGATQLIFIYILLTIKKGPKVDAQVWEGAHGLEWTLPSPAPYHSFTEPPVVE